MKLLVMITALLAAAPAFASHPHDRVCVGSAQLKNQSPVEFVLQYEIGRNYDHGGPNEDSHTLIVEASHAIGDYNDADTVKYQSEAVVIAPGRPLDRLPVVLKDSKGEVLFKGSLNVPKETLTGQVRADDLDSNGKLPMVSTTVKLNCVSQPRLTLDEAQN